MAATGTPWFRVYSQLRSHPKLEDLAAELELPIVHALGHVVSLWCWVVDYAADGNITDQTPGRIARGAGWNGDPTSFLNALVSAQFVDASDGTLLLHNWLVYAESYKRAESQREKREKATKKKRPKRTRKQTVTPVPVQSEYSTDTVPTLSGDSTVPVTLRGEERRGEEKSGEETIGEDTFSLSPAKPSTVKKGQPGAGRVHSDADLVIAYYLEKWPPGNGSRGKGRHLAPDKPGRHKHKDYKFILDRLAEGSTAEELCRAIDGNAIEKWHRDNDNHGYAYVFRDATKVEKFVKLGVEGPQRTMSERTKQNIAVAQEWLAEEQEKDELARQTEIR